MPIQSLIFSHGVAPAALELDSPPSLRDFVGSDKTPAAIVVRFRDLARFLACGDPFKGLHRKHPAKPLAKLLLGHDGQIPVIDTGYGSMGRLKQGVDTYLDNAVGAGERGICVLGVDDDVFLDARRAVDPEGVPAPDAAEESRLFDLLEELPVPEELSQRFLGDSKDHRLVRQLVLRAAQVDTTVLILGDTGTGKNVVARAIHDLGNRRGKPFVTINCAAIPSQLLESELFGHMPGAFTDARSEKRGQWEIAGAGTLFLDEIGDLLPDHQAKILHALQESRIRRVGGQREIEVHARIIAATNRNVYGMAQSGRFREDLYYRLRQFVIRTPDLQDDPEALALIARSLWRRITHTLDGLPQEIVDDLCAHRWPGNVRELRSVLTSLENFFGGKPLRREHIRAVFQYCGVAAGNDSGPAESDEIATLRVDCLRQIYRADEIVRACEEAVKPLAEGAPITRNVRSTLQRNRLEMRAALRQRLRFGSQEAYQAVQQVEEDLERLLAMPADDAPALAQYWHSTLEANIRQAVSRLFERQKELMTEA
jgi:transcriptional regulator with GAF, ATPase, and Fis domain